MIEDLFAGFDPAEVQAARGRIAADKAETRKAVARKSANRHHLRRAQAEATLAEILPPRIEPGDSPEKLRRRILETAGPLLIEAIRQRAK